MKKIAVIAAAITFFGLTACEKCYECEYPGSTASTDEICSKKKKDLDEAVDALEILGWECTKK